MKVANERVLREIISSWDKMGNGCGVIGERREREGRDVCLRKGRRVAVFE